MWDNLTVFGHFSELEHQIVLKFSEILSQGEILAELEQNFAELEQKFAELGQNLALSQGPNSQKKPCVSSSKLPPKLSGRQNAEKKTLN